MWYGTSAVSVIWYCILSTSLPIFAVAVAAAALLLVSQSVQQINSSLLTHDHHDEHTRWSMRP